MGTQFQGLTASRAWGPEALQADSARNLEAQHVLQLPDVVGKLVDLLGHGKPFLLVSPSIMAHDLPEIGRASCRERVCLYV